MKRVTSVIQFLWGLIDVLVAVISTIIVFLILDNYDKVLGFKVYPDHKYFIAFTGLMIPLLISLLFFLIFFTLNILQRIPSHPKSDAEPLLKKKHFGPILISISSFILASFLTNLLLILTKSTLSKHIIFWGLVGLIIMIILFISLNYIYHSFLIKRKSTSK